MRKTILIAAGIGLVAGGCTSAPSVRPAPRGTYSVPPAASTPAASLQVALSAEQAALVRPFLAGAPTGNGRGRRGGLPPGVARNLQRGKALPPGIAKQYLPAHVIAGLPRLPSGLDYIVVAGKLLLVEAATAVVHDVLLDVAFDR